MSDKNEKPLTLNDLAQFTEEVLLPAIGSMIDDKLEIKFEEKLTPIKIQLSDIQDDLRSLEEKINRIAKAGSEDVTAVNGDMEVLKEKIRLLEKRIHILESAQI